MHSRESGRRLLQPVRPLPVVYMSMMAILVIIAAVYGLVIDDAYG
jgi:hypothetical protein